MAIRVLLADDHKLLRQGLSSLLEQHGDISVVAEANTGREAVLLTAKHEPDVVIMDVSMPELNGIDATRQIVARLPKTNVIALTMHADREMMMEMFQAGAKGYVLKGSAFEELSRAIRAVAKGQLCSRADAKRDGGESSRGVRGTLGRLTQREREVLQLIAEGNGTKQIASKLALSSKTVETHRQHVMEKLKLFSIAELTKYAIRQGLTTM